MGNRTSTLSLPWGGQDTTRNNKKRKRDGSSDSAELRLPNHPPVPMPMQKQQPGIVALDTNEVPSFSAMPESILLHIFSFVLKPQKGTIRDSLASSTLKVQLALEKTCLRFSTLLHKDSTIKLLYEGLPDVEFEYQVDSEREKLFLLQRIGRIRHSQNKTDKIICHHMGGADGVRTIVDRMLDKMEVPRDDGMRYIGPPWNPENGFKLFLRGDSIAYLTQVVEQHMLHRLRSVMKAVMYRSHPPSSHSYPTVCLEDLLFVDNMICESGMQLYTCRDGRYEVHSCARLSAGNSDNMWKWQHEECTADDVIGAEQKQRMVRDIASHAGIVKLTGDAFDCIAAEILHLMAVIVVHAFEASKSLWCHDENIWSFWDDDDDDGGGEDYFYAAIDDTIGKDDEHRYLSSESSNEYEVDYANQPPPPPKTVDDKDGKQLCVIIPRQIKDAAVRIGMKPLGDGQGWEASEGRSKHEEVEEAIEMYESSSEDEDSSDEESGDIAEDNGQECYCDYCLEGCLEEDVNSAGDLGDHASEAEEDDAGVNVGEVVEVAGIENLVAGNDEIVGDNIDQNDFASHSSLSY